MSRLRNWASGSWIKTGLLILVALFVLIQFVPYGHSHSNPPVTQAAQFDSPQTEQLFSDACGACHSNLTNWPADSYVAPSSWLVQSDVDGGRSILNTSEWDRAQQAEIGEISNVISEGEMPPLQYKVLHPSARLSDTEKQQLIDGLTKTYQQDPPGP
jgi:mono/diheme cytochrome c family protein